MQIHDLKEYPCDKCQKVFHSSSSLCQHKLGGHGNGMRSLCGDFYRWPDSKNKHQADCPQCIAALQNKSDYLTKSGTQGMWNKNRGV